MSKLMSYLRGRAGFFVKDFRVVGWFYFVVLLVASLLQYLIHSKAGEGVSVFRYNNYIIFRQAFFHLMEAKDLYILYPTEHWDLYKYSPTFALFMAPMALLPDYLGLVLWNALNAGLLFYAIRQLPFQEDRIKIIILWFIFQELLTAIQNTQSNALMAALLILAFNSFEKRNVMMASLYIVLGIYIKIFAIVGAALFLLYPKKWAFVGFGVMWFVLLLCMPLAVNSPDTLINQYQSWWQMLSEDHSISDGLSVMGWLRTWFHIEGSKDMIVLVGALLFCVPLLMRKLFQDLTFRLLFISSILIWIVIFNHKAESPTFVIAMCGVGIWYFIQEKTTFNLILVILAFVFTSLSPTDIFPSYVSQYWVKPYVLKAVFCIFIWFKIIYQMVFHSYRSVIIPQPEQ